MHSFCATCIQSNLNEETNDVICDICCRSTKIPDGKVSSLTTNFILQNVIDALAEISRTSDGISVCGECEQDVATSFCCDCFIKFCASCTTHHLRSKKFKGHVVFEIDQVSRNVLYEGRQKKCQTHDIILRYFCDDCQISTCHDCTIGNLHNNHTYFLLDDIVLQNKNELHDFFEKIQEKKKLLSKAIISSQNMLEKIRVEKNNSINLINETYEQIQEALNKKKEMAIRNLEENYEINKSSVDRVLNDSEILEKWATFTEKVLDNRGHADIMDNYSNLKNQLALIADVTLVKRKISAVEKPSESPVQTLVDDGPRRLNRNPNAKSKPRLSRRNRAKSMENINTIPKPDVAEVKKNRRSVSFYPDDIHINVSSNLNNRAKSDDSIMRDKSNLHKQYILPYSTETTTFTQTKEVRRKAPPRPIPPRKSSVNARPSPTPPERKSSTPDIKSQYVVSVTSKLKHPKRLPPPPPPPYSSKSRENDMMTDVTQDLSETKEIVRSQSLNSETENIDKTISRSSSTPPEKPERKNAPVRRNSSTPEPRPRFLAGIKMTRQKLSVNNVILNLLIESLSDSFKLGKKETGPFYVEAAYGDVLFEYSEEIVCQ